METTQTQSNPTTAPQPNAVQFQKPQGNNTAKVILILLASCFFIVILIFGAFMVGGFFLKKAIEKNGPEFTKNLIEEGIKKQTGVDMDVSDKLPTDFPKDVAIYQGAKVVSAISGKNTKDNESTMIVVFTTPDSTSMVSDFYKTQLPANGWEVTGTYNYGDTYTLSGEKDTRNLSIVIGKGDNDQTSITVTIGTKQNSGSSEGSNSGDY